MSKTWCPLPWVSQELTNNGNLRVCAPSKSSKSKGVLKNEKGEIYNVTKDDLEEAGNSLTLKKMRLQILKGEYPEQCVRCHKEEASGISSRRMFEVVNCKDFISFEKAAQTTSPEGEVDRSKYPIVHYELRLGNHCNLKCRMCGPTDSDSWYSDTVKVWGVNIFKDSHGQVELIKKDRDLYETKNKDYDWINSNHFWNQIQKNIPNIKFLHITGGEPLLIKKHYEFLSMIVKKGYAKNITIDYNSNLTFLPDKALELWSYFKKIQIAVSIDGYGKVNDYIRYPSQFKKIEKNLEKLDQSSNNNYSLQIAGTVQVYNIFYLTDFIEWKLKKHFHHVNSINKGYSILNLHPLFNPSFLNVKILPKKSKDQIKEKFLNFLISLKDITAKEGYSQKDSLKIQNLAKKMLHSYLNYMYAEDWSHIIPKFIKYTKSLDQIRKQKMELALPELYDSLKSSKIDL